MRHDQGSRGSPTGAGHSPFAAATHRGSHCSHGLGDYDDHGHRGYVSAASPTVTKLVAIRAAHSCAAPSFWRTRRARAAGDEFTLPAPRTPSPLFPE